MTDLLLGVIVGGAVAGIAPLAMLALEFFKWKRQVRLEHLRIERKRLLGLYGRNLRRFSRAMADNDYPSEMFAEFLISMPREVSAEFRTFMADPDKSRDRCKRAYLAVVAAMYESLEGIDRRIEKIVS